MVAMHSAPVLAQQANSEKRATYKDWEVHCIKGTDTCAMQQVGSTAQEERALYITIQRVKNTPSADGRAIPAVISALAPLGVLIPYGLRAVIDAGDPTGMPFERCGPAGCVASAPMSDQTVTRMKKGNRIVFKFALDREIDVPISLSGFTAAYNSLTPIEPQRR